MRIFCWVYILSVVIISPLFLDLYPFSVFPMFSENVSERLFVEIADEFDNPLPPQNYGLLKVQIANGQQRYGYDLGPSYFDHYSEIEPKQVKVFLEAYYPHNQYPIVVKYRVRGYDEATARVTDLQEQREFTIAFDKTKIRDRIANSHSRQDQQRPPLNGDKQ